MHTAHYAPAKLAQQKHSERINRKPQYTNLRFKYNSTLVSFFNSTFLNSLFGLNFIISTIEVKANSTLSLLLRKSPTLRTKRPKTKRHQQAIFPMRSHATIHIVYHKSR